MKWPRFSLREQRIILIGGGLLLAVFFYLYVVSPFMESKKNMKNQIALKKDRLVKELNFIAEKEDYEKQLDALNKKLDHEKTKLLNETNVRDASQHLQQTLRDMATRAGVEVNRISPQREERLVSNQRDDKSAEEYLRIPVNIEIHCMPDQMVQFLLALRNYEKRLWVDQLNIFTTTARTAKDRDVRIRPTLTVSGLIKNIPEKKEELAGASARQKI